MTEAELVNRLRAQDRDALAYLRQHYGPLIRYLIRPILTDERDREEAFSDIELRIWERIRDFDPQKGKFTPWLCALARNAAVDRARKTAPAAEELKQTIPAPDSDPEVLFLKKERDKMLKNALYQLPYDERLLFFRKYYYRQSTAQIAAELGTSVRAIEGRLYRIKQKLRLALGGEGRD